MSWAAELERRRVPVGEAGWQGVGVRVQVFGQHGVTGRRAQQRADPYRQAGSTRRRVRPGQGPGEEIAGGDIVQVQGVVQRRVTFGRRVQRGEQHQRQPTRAEQRGGDRVRDQVQRAGAQQPAHHPAYGRRGDPQQQRHRGAEHQPERGQHAEQQVLRHVPARVVGERGQRPDGDRQQGAADQPGGGTPVVPTPRVAYGRQQVADGQQHDREQREPARALRHVPAVRRRGRHGHRPARPSPGRRDRAHHTTATPASSSTAPDAIHTTSYGSRCTP